MVNLGYKNEYDFIRSINNKKLNEINFLLQDMILFLYPYITKDSIIKCYKNVEYEKGDICIIVEHEVKYVSIKMGHRNSIHCESIKKFKKFLKNIGVSELAINEILKYQYADGTLDGTGINRKSIEEYKRDNKCSIIFINNELNNREIIRAAVNRFIIQGTQMHTHRIDLLVYGTPEDFFYITPNEIHEYMQIKKDNESSAIHFSCLTFQPLSRNLNYNDKLEYMRHWIQIKWYNLEDNIIELMNQRIL